MPRARRLLLIAAALVGLAVVAACGEQGISVPPAQRPAAEVFVLHCSGCHTLQQAGTQGSATDVRTREYKDGPNFNQRHETVNCVLYAIRNGGFSSGPMPQNILTGEEAQAVAKFVAENSKPQPTGVTAVKIPDCPPGVVLDLRAISRDPEPVRAALARRRDGSEERLDGALELYTRWTALRPELEGLQARRNEASAAIGRAKQAGEDAAGAIAEMQDVARRVKALEAEADSVEAELAAANATLPNPPDPTAADADTTLREWGEGAPSGRDHLELAGPLIDMEAGAKVAGSRFAYLKGDLVFLELALVRWVLEKLRGHGFEAVIPPVLVREEALFGTGMLPDTEQQIYRIAEDPLYLSGTSEVALASLHAGEIMDAVPRRYAGFSPCFRREAGAAGRDTRGIFRVHQFDKVEMFSFVEPGDSPAEHERLLAIEEEILQGLGIPYRVVNIAVDDLGASAAKKFDLEGWLPSQQQHRELTSTSNTTDFQSRRLDIRYRPDGGRPAHVHTLNGTAVAVGRTLIALMENHQREDGTVAVPEALVSSGAPAVLGG